MAGSVSQNKGTSASDLDLVIVFDALPAAYIKEFAAKTSDLLAKPYQAVFAQEINEK